MSRNKRSSPFQQPNFTRYFFGQVLSNVGIWFQNLALQLVVLGATGSAQSLSGITMAQFLPVFLLGLPAGRLLDRISPRTVLLATSFSSAIVTGGMIFVITTEPVLWKLYVMVALLGSIQAFERVAAQTIIFELVGAEKLSQAASISTIALAAARSIGPALAGITFQWLGTGPCILINAIAYLAVFAVRWRIRVPELFVRSSAHQATGQSEDATPDPAREKDLLRNRDALTVLVVNVAISILAMNFGLVLTATINLSFGGSATAIGAVHTLNAIGAILGGVLVARNVRVKVRSLALATAIFSAALAISALAPTLPTFLLAAPLLGAGIGYYQGTLNAAAQESVAPRNMGHMMSLMTLGGYGVVPLGAVFMGWLIDASSGRIALAVSAVATTTCAIFIRLRTRAS